MNGWVEQMQLVTLCGNMTVVPWTLFRWPNAISTFVGTSTDGWDAEIRNPRLEQCKKNPKGRLPPQVINRSTSKQFWTSSEVFSCFLFKQNQQMFHEIRDPKLGSQSVTSEIQMDHQSHSPDLDVWTWRLVPLEFTDQYT